MPALVSSLPPSSLFVRYRTPLLVVAFGVWGASLIVICAYLLGGHLLTLPTPDLDNPVLRGAIDARRQTPENWVMLHVLYGDCGCSRRVVHHLSERGPSGLAEERVIIVDPRPADLAELEGAGFAVELSSREALATAFAVRAAPILAIAAPDGTLRYVGGYTARKRGPDIADLALLHASRSGDDAEALPLFGCAVSRELAVQVDPLGLR